jgi:hypothetical protein
MQNAPIVTLTDDATDAMFDTSAPALARRFGDRTIELMRTGRDPKQTARLAFSYAARALTQGRVSAGPWSAK